MSFRQGSSLFLLPLLVSIVIFSPGLTGGFAFDDINNITRNDAIKIDNLRPETLLRAAFSTESGPLRRPIAMASFAANYSYSEFSLWSWKLTNIVIHGCVAAAVALLAFTVTGSESRLSRGLTPQQRYWGSLAAGLLFAVHPFNLSPALYIVQRMTSLSALFLFISASCYVWARRAETRSAAWPRLAAAYALMTTAFVAGLLSKESTASGMLLFPILESVCFRFSSRNKNWSRTVKGLHLLSVATFFLIVIKKSGVTETGLTTNYVGRSFSPIERLLTEARAVCFYLKESLAPNLTQMGMHHDDWPVSTTLHSPPETLLSAFLLTALLFACVAGLKQSRWLWISFALAWFLAGHVLESTFIPLELVHEHRNYVPIAGLCIAVPLMLMDQKAISSHRLKVGLVGSALMVLSLLTYSRAATWSDPVTHAFVEAQHHPNSFRSVYTAAYASYGYGYYTGDPKWTDTALTYLREAMDLGEQDLLAPFELLRLSQRHGRPLPDGFWEDFLERPKTANIRANNAEVFDQLVECYSSGACEITLSQLKRFIQAGLSNPAVSDQDRARILNIAGVVDLQFYDDIQSAVANFENAAELHPSNIIIKYNLFSAHRSNEDFASAESTLRELRLQLKKPLVQYQSDLTIEDVDNMLNSLARDTQHNVEQPDKTKDAGTPRDE